MIERPPFPQVFDSSMLSAFRGCPKKYYYNYLLGLSKPGHSIHLHFGGIIAAAVEHTRKAFYGDGLSQPEAVLKGAQHILKSWGEVVTPEKSAKTLENCLLTHADYFVEYPLAYDFVKPFKLANGTLSVECNFALPLDTRHPTTGEPLVYCGRFDMLGKSDNGFYVVDEKTTASLGGSWAAQFNNRAQLTGYAWGAKTFGFPLSGIIIRGVGILSKETKFQQVIQQRPDWQIALWKEQTERDLKRIIASWEAGWFDMVMDKGCADFGQCTYLTLCTSKDPENWMGDYVISHWNPLHRDGD